MKANFYKEIEFSYKWKKYIVLIQQALIIHAEQIKMEKDISFHKKGYMTVESYIAISQ